MKNRLDQYIVQLGLFRTRSQAESYIKLGEVTVNGKIVTKPGFLIGHRSQIAVTAGPQYVSRAALKLASVAEKLRLNFKDKLVLDVGSSTGGFTDYALKHGARNVIAVEVGSGQLHESLRNDSRIELYEKTDIRDFKTGQTPDTILIDVSFISLRQILPSISAIAAKKTVIVAMVKPQFEASSGDYKHKGVIKNDSIRRDIFKDFEKWATQTFIIAGKADSGVSGAKGNQERFYLLHKA